MHRNRILIYIISLAFLTACIKPFTPDIDSDAASKIVVSGKVTNIEGYQTVSISKSTPLNGLDDEVISNCQVSIWDDLGNEYPMNEYESGEYRVWMDAQDLNIGTAYHIEIKTPEGEELISDPDIMPSVAPINMPTYKIDSAYNGVFQSYDKGLQFYIDIDGNENTSKYYLFEMDATYEHHAEYDREWFYDGQVNHIYPPDSSLYFCWTTERVPEILLLSTENLTENKFRNFNLHFVTFRADYFTYGYSLMIKQTGLSREAFLYWENMRLNNNQNAALYSKQPVDTQGNIKNITHPDKEVLGFFSASAVSSMRIFIEKQATTPLTDCAPAALDRIGFRNIGKLDYPAFLMNNPKGTFLMVWLFDPCVNCASLHGTTVKPDFWPY